MVFSLLKLEVGCVWAEILSCGCAWEYIHHGTSLWDILGSVRLVLHEPWTLIYLAKFWPLLPFLTPAHLPVLQYFCSFPCMFCSSRPPCVQKLWWGLCHLHTSCFQWVLDLGTTLVRVFGPKACGRWTQSWITLFSFQWNKWYFNSEEKSCHM